MDGISKWIFGWKKNGWKTADKKPVKNAELWQALELANQRHKVKWHWVKGHAGHPENERGGRRKGGTSQGGGLRGKAWRLSKPKKKKNNGAPKERRLRIQIQGADQSCSSNAAAPEATACPGEFLDIERGDLCRPRRSSKLALRARAERAGRQVGVHGDRLGEACIPVGQGSGSCRCRWLPSPRRPWTKASLTESTAISSTPLARMASRFSR